MIDLPRKMLKNLYQLDKYVDEYCAQGKSLSWCEEQLAEFHHKLSEYTEKVNKEIDNNYESKN